MKTFTFFYNRYETATTSKALADNDIEHYVMIHSESDYEKFMQGGTMKGIPVITNNDKGLAYQRNSALDMVNDDEWCVFMCDDFQIIKAFNFDRFKIDEKDDQGRRLCHPSGWASELPGFKKRAV